MTTVSAPAASTLQRASGLSGTGRCGDAARLLYAELHRFDPLDETVDECRAQLAAAYVQPARDDGGAHRELMLWAGYAYRTYRSVYGPDHDTTLIVGTWYVELLLLRGCPREAAVVAEQVADGFADRYGPHDPRTMLSGAALTMILLRLGRLGGPRTLRVGRAGTTHPTHDVSVTVGLLRTCSIVATTTSPHVLADSSTVRPADDDAPPRRPGPAGRDRR